MAAVSKEPEVSPDVMSAVAPDTTYFVMYNHQQNTNMAS